MSRKYFYDSSIGWVEIPRKIYNQWFHQKTRDVVLARLDVPEKSGGLFQKNSAQSLFNSQKKVSRKVIIQREDSQNTFLDWVQVVDATSNAILFQTTSLGRAREWCSQNNREIEREDL